MILSGTPTGIARTTQTPSGGLALGTAAASTEVPAAAAPSASGARPTAHPTEGGRCAKSDLPIGQCGDTCCRPDLAESDRFVPGEGGSFVPIQYLGTWREAAHPGVCPCGCETRFTEGTEIILGDLDGSGGENDGWCLLEHTRPAHQVFGGGH